MKNHNDTLIQGNIWTLIDKAINLSVNQEN